MLVICKNCGVEFEKRKSQIRRSPNHFCSKGCSAIFNNKLKPKRLPEGSCLYCKQPLSKRYRLCKTCTAIYLPQNMTIKEYQQKESVQNKHPSWKNAHIRNFCRSWNKELQTLPCQNCGYDKHIELAHITPLKDFDENTKLSVVNSKENLLVLCPNCHCIRHYTEE